MDGAGSAPTQGALARQRDRSAMALYIALCIAPFALMVEPLIALTWLFLPNVRRAEQCEGLKMDEGGIGYVVTAALGSISTVLYSMIVVAVIVPRAVSRGPFFVSCGAAVVVSMVFCGFYSLWVAANDVTGLATFKWGSVCVTSVWCLPCAAIFVRHFGARHAKCSVLALAVLAGGTLAALFALYSAVVCAYIVLSNNVRGALGLVINGTSTGLFLPCCGGRAGLT
jgi:hypothetical protein